MVAEKSNEMAVAVESGSTQSSRLFWTLLKLSELVATQKRLHDCAAKFIKIQQCPSDALHSSFIGILIHGWPRLTLYYAAIGLSWHTTSQRSLHQFVVKFQLVQLRLEKQLHRHRKLFSVGNLLVRVSWCLAPRNNITQWWLKHTRCQQDGTAARA